MLHDSAACPHLGIPLEEWLVGLNFRMSELHAAVLLVQLDRLDDLVTAMRERRAALERLLRARLERRGVSFRATNDPDGDTGIASIFFLPDHARVPQVVNALVDDNVPASRLYRELRHLPRDHVDLHAYPSWTPLHRKRAWSAGGGPWRGHPRQIEYPEDACPRTVELLRRAVHVDVSPELTGDQIEQIAAGIVDAVERVV
jgi:dTDP-4-amino-4,6-dideoxygalactose transaminase